MPEQTRNNTEKSLAELFESVKFVADLTSRIDERVKTIVENQLEYEKKIERANETQAIIQSRVSVLESKNGHKFQEEITDVRKNMHKMEIKIAALEIYSARHENKWSMIGDMVTKLLWTIAALAIIYKMGLGTLPLP